MVAVLRNGQVRTEDAWSLPGEECTDAFRKELALPSLNSDVRVRETGQGWRVLVRMARHRLSGVGKSGPLGLQLRWCAAGAVIRSAVCWPTPDRQRADCPFGFGDLLAANAPLAVTSLDFGKPVWQTADVASRLRLCAVSAVSESSARTAAAPPTRMDGGQAAAQCKSTCRSPTRSIPSGRPIA
jgi:hypothetical protein